MYGCDCGDFCDYCLDARIDYLDSQSNSKLLQAFERSGVTTETLAALTGIAKKTLDRWERGETEISTERAYAIEIQLASTQTQRNEKS